MRDIIQQVEKNILKKNLIVAGDNIIVGVSGGADSVFLLTVLNKLRKKINFDIQVAHINHLIREEAVLDEELVKKMCDSFNINFYLLREDVLRLAKEQKISTEECGRNIRYDFFRKIMKEKNGTKIAVAHNIGDNAETIFMNLIRGAGTSGISGMEYMSNDIIRPLLNIEKKEIIEYLESKGIKYNTDVTNLQNDYTRNKIRNDLLKKIEEEYNPSFTKSLVRMGEIISAQNKLLQEYVKLKYNEIVLLQNEKEIIIDLNKVNKESMDLQAELVRVLIDELIGTLKGIEKVHVEYVIDLFSKTTGKRYTLGNKFEVEILKQRKAKFTKLNKEENNEEERTA